MYQQRAVPVEPQTLGLWEPKVEPEDLVFAPAADDRYAVVDDIEEERAVVVLSPWPQVDDRGHLVFSDEATSRDHSLGDLQAVVDSQRRAAGQPAPDRPLRIGDVFWVRGDLPEADDSASADAEVLDVTRAARAAARAAFLVAANPALRTEEQVTPAQADQQQVLEVRRTPPTGATSSAV